MLVSDERMIYVGLISIISLIVLCGTAYQLAEVLVKNRLRTKKYIIRNVMFKIASVFAMVSLSYDFNFDIGVWQVMTIIVLIDIVLVPILILEFRRVVQ